MSIEDEEEGAHYNTAEASSPSETSPLLRGQAIAIAGAGTCETNGPRVQPGQGGLNHHDTAPVRLPFLT